MTIHICPHEHQFFYRLTLSNKQFFESRMMRGTPDFLDNHLPPLQCSPTVDNKLQKVNALMNTGLITQETFEAKAYNLPEHNVVAEAGVGIDIAECHPFMVNGLRAGGPAEKTGVIKVGDLLAMVDNLPLQPHLTGDQVRSLVIGPEGSVVELHFLENPQRTHRGDYRVRLIRKAPNPGGLTRTNAADANAGASGGAVNGVLYSDDFDIDSSEQAIKQAPFSPFS